MKRLKITVSGKAGQGSSTIATVLAEHLRGAGIEVSRTESIDGPLDRTTAQLRLRSLVQSGLSVEIEEVQTARSAL